MKGRMERSLPQYRRRTVVLVEQDGSWQRNHCTDMVYMYFTLKEAKRKLGLTHQQALRMCFGETDACKDFEGKDVRLRFKNKTTFSAYLLEVPHDGWVPLVHPLTREIQQGYFINSNLVVKNKREQVLLGDMNLATKWRTFMIQKKRFALVDIYNVSFQQAQMQKTPHLRKLQVLDEQRCFGEEDDSCVSEKNILGSVQVLDAKGQ